MWVAATLAVVTVVAALLAYSRHRLNLWRSQGVATAPGCLPLIGHMHQLISPSETLYKYMDKVYQRCAARMCGMYLMMNPALYVADTEMIKAILVKDFDHFVDRQHSTQFTGDQDKRLNDMLSNLSGDKWKKVRSVLSPSFTSGKIKGMFPLICQKGNDLVSHINKETSNDNSIVLKKTFGLYTLEVIASCAFGMETNALRDGSSLFADKVEKVLTFSIPRQIVLVFASIFPKIFYLLKINVGNPENKFLVDVVEETLKRREIGGYRGDFLDLMMEARKDQNDPSIESLENYMENSTIISNTFMFIFAGYDTTATTLSYVAFLLASHPEEQQRLRRELESLEQEHGELTYHSLVTAKLLDAVISESLRLYPTAPSLSRYCTKTYKIPGTDVTIPKGAYVFVPIWSLHHDPRYWEDPEVFRPDRFLPENKDKIKSGTYLPFGLGPRNCIGMRFAQIEIKICIAKILLSFNVSCAPGYETMKHLKQPGLLKPAEDFKLVFTPLVRKE